PIGGLFERVRGHEPSDLPLPARAAHRRAQAIRVRRGVVSATAVVAVVALAAFIVAPRGSGSGLNRFYETGNQTLSPDCGHSIPAPPTTRPLAAAQMLHPADLGAKDGQPGGQSWQARVQDQGGSGQFTSVMLWHGQGTQSSFNVGSDRAGYAISQTGLRLDDAESAAALADRILTNLRCGAGPHD